MTRHVDAIFANGVLKPLEPLMLPEQARVRLTVESGAQLDEPKEIVEQQAALELLFKAIDRLPQHRNNDGWSAHRHDELLYSKKK